MLQGAWRQFQEEHGRATKTGNSMHAQWANVARAAVVKECEALRVFISHHRLRRKHKFPVLEEVESGLVIWPVLSESLDLARSRQPWVDPPPSPEAASVPGRGAAEEVLPGASKSPLETLLMDFDPLHVAAPPLTPNNQVLAPPPPPQTLPTPRRRSVGHGRRRPSRYRPSGGPRRRR